MKLKNFILLLFLVAPTLTFADSCHTMKKATEESSGTEKISAFGRYQGYSKAIYNSWIRQSKYLVMRDGTRLAIDIIIPAQNCHPTTDRLPVIWTQTPYQRAFYDKNGKIITSVEDLGIQKLIQHGYAFAAVATRGTAASFGRFMGWFPPIERQDAYDVTEWLAKQPWSNGNIGMVGGSYQGITQLMVASLKPPHLKAIFPEVTLFDLYDFAYPGGIFRNALFTYWTQLTHNINVINPLVPVDTDKEGALLMRARQEHASNVSTVQQLSALPFRDNQTAIFSYFQNSPSGQLNQIKQAKVPMYISGGWYDIFIADTFFWYANYTGPIKMMIGPWPHNSKGAPASLVKERDHLTVTEELRWFDYWLKGINNNIMLEKPINYVVMMGNNMPHYWQQSDIWPPANVHEIKYYLNNNYQLSETANFSQNIFDLYRINYTTTTGIHTRWRNAVGKGPIYYPDMTMNDKKSLTYTTAALKSDMLVIGFPVVTLYFSSTANDNDFHILLEEVDKNNVSHYISEGLLRASQRKLNQSPWQNYGLPFQRHNKQDIAMLVAGEITQLKFYLLPIAKVFQQGERIRLVIMGADEGNTANLVFPIPPIIKVFHSKDYDSNIMLPVK